MALLTPGTGPLLLARCLLALGCTAAVAAEGRGQEAPPVLEREVKAAYLLNFTRYVDWPPETLPTPDSPVNICVFGEDDFGDIVRRTVEGRRTRGRPVRVLRPDTPTRTDDCHVAFVGGSRRAAREWLRALRGSPTLTVGDGADFLERGGMVAFVIVQETVRFEIDAAAARRAGLAISSRVLALATRVSGEPAEDR